ncbi:helix-turn-helix transcriptional regulator [Streptomyces sp. NPDC049577]|uniref:response regulator transcription factor n=1 Tax=Streptomyces sp. NPDC049577 TaxID=3155153 RepID=UPI003414BAA7
MPHTSAVPPVLTPREQQVLALLADGETYWAIARRLGISRHTVDTHLRRLRTKTGAANRTQLAVLALQRGYVHHADAA